MLKITINNATVRDNGYGLEVNGNSLEDIISTALGAKLGNHTAGYSGNGTLKEFKCNSCDISIIIDPHPVSVEIEMDEHKWDSVDAMEEELNGQFEKKTTEAES